MEDSDTRMSRLGVTSAKGAWMLNTLVVLGMLIVCLYVFATDAPKAVARR